MFKLYIKIMLLLPLLVACGKTTDPEWIKGDNGVKMYMTDTIGSFFTQKIFSWEGDSICGLAHGQGRLTVSDKDDGTVLFTRKIKAYYGNLEEATIEKVLKEKHPYYYYGDKDKNGADGFGVLISSTMVYVGDFEDGEGNGMVSAFKNDTLLYVGEWSDSHFHGEGKEFYPNGKIRYDGHWSKSAYNGRGTYYDEKGIPHKHVWANGKLPEIVSQRYLRLKNNKEAMSEKTYMELKASYYIWEVAYIWIYIGFVLALLILLHALNVQYNTHYQNKYRDISPLAKSPLYIRWILGGMWGLHRARLCSKSCYLQYILFATLILSCADNISMYILHPSVWFLLPQWNIVTKLSFLFTMLWWMIDAFWIPYGRYLYINKYFRRSEHEFDILKGNVTQVEQFYSDLSHTFDERNMNLKSHLAEAQACACETNPSTDWAKKLGGGLNFEKKKFENMQRISDEMNDIYHDFQADNYRMMCYLTDARIAAVRNLYLAKELIQIVHSLKGKEQILRQDELEMLDINIDITMPNMKLDTEKIIQDTVMNAMKSYNLILRSGMGKGAATLAGGAMVIAGVADYISNRNQQRETLAKKSLELVDSMKEAMDKVTQSQAQMLRASELLSALYNANKAFIAAYTDLRDLCFGEVSFRSFWHGTIKEQEAYETNEFKQSMQHLINVCNEYNKINQQTLGNSHENIQ